MIRVGVIGLGAIGAWHARIVAEGGDHLAAVCDIDRSRAEAHAHGAAVFDTPDAMLTSGLDAVIIATPEAEHEAHAIAAARAGAAVLIEKPVAPDMAAMHRMAAAIEAAGVLAMAAHVERFEAGTAGLQVAVAQGVPGRVSAILARRQFGPAEVARFAGQSSTLRVLGIHDFDLVRWLHPGAITAVHAMAGRGSIHAAHGLDDHVVTTLSFADGAMACIESAWTLPRAYQVYDSPAGWGAAGNNRLEVFGDAGFVSNDMSLRTQPLVAFDAAEGFRASNLRHQVAIHGRVQGALRTEVEYFLDCVRTGAAPLVGIADALRAVALLEAAETSLATGRPAVPDV
ncbi:MAG: Gfo/Idh/MocA family oxidoreductase [Pseudomonadota bacterium]